MNKRELFIAFLIVILLIGFIVIYFSKDKVKDEIRDYANISEKAENNLLLVKKDYKIYSEVWSQNSPYGASYEYKVNCAGEYDKLETCFLYDLDEVIAIDPNSKYYNLKKDFNINSYSGEITRRWVLYGPSNGSLPKNGEYLFRFVKNGSLLFEEHVNYSRDIIDYPKKVQWQRRGNDLYVNWTPPNGIDEKIYYKVIIWEEYGTPDLFISNRFGWNQNEATLYNVSLINGGNYSLNVAVYFREGYAFSEYIKFKW